MVIFRFGPAKPSYEKSGDAAIGSYAGVGSLGAKKKKKAEYVVETAPDVESKVNEIIDVLSYGHMNESRIICMRSRCAIAKAYARIWNLPYIWQKALGVGTFYVIEVLSQHYDHLAEEEKEKVLIHELLHIPKTFSGALRPHGGRVKIDQKTVGRLHRLYLERKREKYGRLQRTSTPEDVF